MSILDKLQEQDVVQKDTPFGGFEEDAIISLALDHPEFFGTIARFIRPDMFSKLSCQFVITHILNAFEKYEIVPTRGVIRDNLIRTLRESDPYEEILATVDRPSNYREVPVIKDLLIKWARNRAFGMIYSEEAQEAYHRGDYDFLEKTINEANRITDVSNNGFWFFKNLELLFEENIIEHRTTGFANLDKVLNEGGPSPKEVVCYLAATGVGKSILLCNSAISSLKGPGPDGIGQNVLLITFELDTIKTAMRCLGALARDIPIKHFKNHQHLVSKRANSFHNTYNKELVIVEWAPEECSVNQVYALLDGLKRTHSWKPDVIILDYLDLMISRVDGYNNSDYDRQKHVATEVRGLAKNENVLIFTATQTNRSGVNRGIELEQNANNMININKSAESFGKNFAIDYVVSLNQSYNQKVATPPRLVLFVAKNRNGPTDVSVNCSINYDQMLVEEFV